MRDGVSLFTFVDEEGYFSDVRIADAVPQPIKNGSDATGTWDVKLSTDLGTFDGTLQLRRDGNMLSGVWSGAFGDDRDVKGTWRDGYVELSFTGEWPNKMIDGKPGAVMSSRIRCGAALHIIPGRLISGRQPVAAPNRQSPD